MANTGHQGIDVRQTGNRLVFEASLKDSAGAKVTGGSGTLYIYELQSDGTLKSYDFADNTFKTGTLTTETASLTHRAGNNGATNTGLWTYVLTTLSGFTIGSIIIFVVSHASASPPQQERKFQFGGAQGDLQVTASFFLKVDAEEWKGGTIPATAVAGVPKADLTYILGTLLTETAGQIAAAFVKFFNKAAPTGTVNSLPDAVAGAASGLALVGSNVGQATSVSGPVGSVTGNVGGDVVGNVQGNVSGNVGGSVGSVAGNVGGNVAGSVASVTDRTGFSLSAAGVKAFWDQLRSATFTSGSFGEKFKAILAVFGSDERPQISGDAHTGGATIPAVTGPVGSVVGNVGGNVLGTIGGVDVGDILTVIEKLDGMLQLDGSLYQFTVNALENAPAGEGGGGGGDATLANQETMLGLLNAIKPKTDLLVADVPPTIQVGVFGSKIYLTRGDTRPLPFIGLGDLSTATDIIFSIKENENAPDDHAMLRIRMTEGLERLGGAAPKVGQTGAIEVTDESGEASASYSPSAAVRLKPGRWFWDVQVHRSVSPLVDTPRRGEVIIAADISRAAE